MVGLRLALNAKGAKPGRVGVEAEQVGDPATWRHQEELLGQRPTEDTPATLVPEHFDCEVRRHTTSPTMAHKE